MKRPASFLSSILAGILAPSPRAENVNVRVSSDWIPDFVASEIADAKNRAKFPSKKERARMKAGSK